MMNRLAGCLIGASILAFSASAAAGCAKRSLPALDGLWVLAVSWQPGFCESYPKGKPLPKECSAASLTDRFTLHGLWPQWDEFCVKTSDSADAERSPGPTADRCSVERGALPEIPLPADLRTRLETVMPGTRSLLDRYEYFKHGSCSGLEPEAYFKAAIALVEALNATSLRTFLVDRQGRDVSVDELCGEIGKALGEKAPAAVEGESRNRIGFDADRRDHLTELRFWLTPTPGGFALANAGFVPVKPGMPTLGGKARPLCSRPGERQRLYIDRTGMNQ